MWSLLHDFSAISLTMVTTTSPLFSFLSIGLLMLEFFQSFNMRYGFIESPDILAFSLQYGRIWKPINDVEQYIFIIEVTILKREGGKLLQVCVCVYVECLL